MEKVTENRLLCDQDLVLHHALVTLRGNERYC